MLNNAFFFASCLATLEKESHCKLQQTCYMLKSQTSTCNDLKKVIAHVAKSRTQLSFLQLLQAQKIARQVSEKTCYTLQSTHNLSSNAIATQIARGVVSCDTRLICAIVASPKKLRGRLLRRHVTRCNLPTTCPQLDTNCKRGCIM